MPDTRNPFSEKEDVHLVKFLARHNPEPRGRLGHAIYQQLVENADNKWPWAKSHTWQSWRERYKKNQDAFDRKIRLLQKRQQEEGVQDDEQEGPSTPAQKPEHRKKTLFTDSDDEHLAEFLATRGSDMGRLGTSLYKSLEAEAETLPWVKRHPWQSWRERYKKNQDIIEGLVSKYEGGKRVKKEKAAAETGRAEPSVQAPQVPTSNSRGKERQTAIPPPASSKAPHASGSHVKGKENTTSTSGSKGKAKQKDDEAQQDRSTHVEMRQERTAGPAKNQRVQSTTPAPGPKASQPKAPPPPSVNGKGKQNEIEPQAFRVQETPVPALQREISIPPIAIKSQEASDGDIGMHSLFGSDDEEPEIDELEESQSQNIHKIPPRAKLVAPSPPPKKDLPAERILVPSSSQVTPPSSPAKPPVPPLSAVQPLRKKPPFAKPRLAKKDENIFVSSDAEPSSPSPSPPRPAKKSSPRKHYSEAPKIVEGPYRSHLKRVRSRIESDSDEAPPKRARRNPESGSSHKKGEKMQVDLEERGLRQQKKENINPEVAAAPTAKKGATQLHHARKSASQNASVARAPAPTHGPMVVSPPAVVPPHAVEPLPFAPRREAPENAIASSSGVRLSDIPPAREETPVVPTTTPASARRSKPPAHQLPLPRKGTPVVPTTTPASTGRSQPPAPGSTTDLLPSVKDSVAHLHPSQSRNTEHTLQEAPPRRDSGVVISPGGESETDFFNAPLHILSAGNSKGKEREYALDVRPPRIDLLRESLNRRRSQIHSVRGVARTDSHASSAASNSTTSERRGSAAVAHNRQARMSVASEDAVSALLEWMPPLISIAAEYNVADSVAVKLFKRLMSMEKTEVVLFAQSCDLTEEDGLKAYNKKKTVARAKEALALFAQSKKMFEEDVSSGSGEEDMPSGLVLRSQAPSASAAKVERRESGANAQAQASSAKRRRSRPSLIIRRIPTDQDAAMSDYIPPKNSRAGQYARLQKQGRVAEAKEREMNRVLITETQTQYVPVRMHSPTVSPSPYTRLQVQEVSQVMMDVDAMRIDENYHEEQGHDEGQEGNEEEQEQHDDSDEYVYVDAEEESQRDDVAMVESSEDEDLGVQAGDGSVVHAVDDDEEEQGEEVEEHGDVEQPSDAEEEDQEEEQAMVEEEQEGEDSEDPDDADEGEQHDEEDNGIFGSRESEDELEEQYYYERGTSTTNSDFDRDESHRPSSPPPNKEAVEDHPGNNVAEENDFAQNTGIVDEDDDDIYMPESLEMPYPGQPQRYEESQGVPEAELEAEAPAQSSSSHMQPSSLPYLLTFGSGGPDKNPAFADVAKTHRQLTLNATAENYQELRNFEEKHSDKSDLMRLWSIKWAKVLMRHDATDNEES